MTQIVTIYIANILSVRDIAQSFTHAGFVGLTVVSGWGVWEGKTEPCHVITLANTRNDPNFVKECDGVASHLCQKYGEDCAMLTVHSAQVSFPKGY